MENNLNAIKDQFIPKEKITALDIFSGCGGLSLGLERAGIHVKYSIEFWKPAADTHHYYFKDCHTFCKNAEEFLKHIKVANELKKRFGLLDKKCQIKGSPGKKRVIHIKNAKRKKDGSLWLMVEKQGQDLWMDVEKMDSYRAEIVHFLSTKYANIPAPDEIDLIAGGPPCQGFSLLNRFKETDSSKFLSHDKNRLVLVFLDYVKYFKPKYVLIENVTGILNTTVFDVPSAIIEKLDARGYEAKFSTVNAQHFGVSF